MYAACLRCDRSLGTNTEIAHLPVGRRIAFDAARGRVWVICARCGQWNLTPIEERWEALGECEALARSAEAHGAGVAVALARTESGLELLRVGGMSDADIANWRYGRRIQDRQHRQALALMPLGGIAVSLAIITLRTTGSLTFGFYVLAVSGIALFRLWLVRPRLWRRFSDGEGRRRFLWPWQRSKVRLETDLAANGATVLVVPQIGGDLRVQGARAAEVLASLLPGFNGADCVGVKLDPVLERVTDAEDAARRGPKKPGRGARRRMRATGVAVPPQRARPPWEHLVSGAAVVPIAFETPALRLALEMAVTEEVERRELASRAEVLAEERVEEEEVGAISDDLLLPSAIEERLRAMKGDPGNLGARDQISDARPSDR